MSMSCERTGFVKVKEQKHFGSLIWRSNLEMPWSVNSLFKKWTAISNLVPLLIATLEASLIFIRRTFWMKATTAEPAQVRRCASAVLFLTASAAT